MKPKIYFYPGSRDRTEMERMGYTDCHPFSPEGILRHVEPVDDPAEAQLFYAGQFHDKMAWRLAPERFGFFAGNEGRHVFDIEGDWRGMEIPEWLRQSVLIAVNARRRLKDWPHVMVRPPCSRLLVHLAREGPGGFSPPASRSVWFRGQRDSLGLRQRLGRILDDSRVPADIAFNGTWGAVLDVDNELVRQYDQGMREHAFILCPAGEGQATVRPYEACYYGRIPIVVADCLWMSEDQTDTSFCFGIPPEYADEQVSGRLREIVNMSDSEIEDRCRMAALYWEHVVRFYFRDPMGFFLTWMAKRVTGF